METFREEHYEIQEKHGSGWMDLGGFYPKEFDAKGAIKKIAKIRNSKKSNYRIIRCTTIREVIEK